MTVNSLAKLCLALSFISLIIWVVAFASPHWLYKDFTINVPGFMLGLPSPLNASQFPVRVKSNVGLLTACDYISVKIFSMPERKKEECNSDGAEDWQYAAAASGIAGVVFAVAGLGLSTAVVFLYRKTFYKKLRIATIIVYVFTTIFIIICIILSVTGKEFHVRPPLPDRVDFDLEWALWVAVASDVLYAILTALHIVQLLTYFPTQDLQKDPSASYRVDYSVPNN